MRQKRIKSIDPATNEVMGSNRSLVKAAEQVRLHKYYNEMLVLASRNKDLDNIKHWQKLMIGCEKDYETLTGQSFPE